MANKIGSFIAHTVACGIMIAGFVFDETDFTKAILLATLAETMAIYFNTSK